ncbi:unnamed protein product, partial [Mesorhabditis spiculigera]
MGNETPARVTGYYVVFPYIPEDSMENNPYMRNIAKNEDWPLLATASPRDMYEGTIKMFMDYAATSLEHMEHLEQTKGETRTFENTVEPLLHDEYEVNYAFQTLLLKMVTDWSDTHNNMINADMHHVTIMWARDMFEKLTAPAFQAAIKEMYDKKDGLDEWQLRLLEWYILELKANGHDRQDEKTRKILGSWNRFIDQYRSKYITNVMATNDQHKFVLQDKSALADAPPHILQTLAADQSKWETGPWVGYMAPRRIFALMQYCGDRQIRAGAWEKWISKASFEHDFYNNSINIEELRHNNEGMAKVLGYTSTSEHRLANKMATSPETVRSMIQALERRVRPVFMDRMDAWRNYVHNNHLMSGDLYPHDLFYVCRKEAFAHYDVNHLDLMNYFPFWPTFENVTSVIGQLFNLTFKDITNTNLERAHPDAKIFAVADTSSGHHLGRLYVDPYDRQNKLCDWTTLLGRTESKERGLDKLVYLVGAASAPANGQPSLLHYEQLQRLLFHVGRSVQMLLSRAPYRDIAVPWAPFHASDWDSLDMFPTFCQFFLNKPNLLQAIASPHIKTGAQLHDDTAESTSLALSRASLFETYRTLFWSDFDLTLFEMEDRRQKFWLDLYRELHKEYFPWRLQRNDYQPCSFMPIFSRVPHYSGYYSKLWSEMLALDIHETFRLEGDESKTGERLKTLLLNKGAGDVAKELYRRFQGRDPSVGPICDFYDPPPFEEHQRLEENFS